MRASRARVAGGHAGTSRALLAVRRVSLAPGSHVENDPGSREPEKILPPARGRPLRGPMAGAVHSGGGRGEFLSQGARDPRSRRGIRLRKDDYRENHSTAHTGDVGPYRLRRPRHYGDVRARATAVAPPDADDLSGPGRGAQPQDARTGPPPGGDHGASSA